MQKTRILILAPFPKGMGPSQRFRLEIYFKALRARGVEFEYHVFLDEKAYLLLYKEGHELRKAWWIIKGMFSRLRLMTRLNRYTHVFVEREAAPLGPPIFEWMIAKLWGKKMIYNIDDALWVPNFAEANARFKGLKYFSKIDSIMSWSHRVIAGNKYLAARALQFADDVVVIPTIVDTDGHHVERSVSQYQEPLTLGWTGTHSTNKHLEHIWPVINGLMSDYDFRLVVISNARPDIDSGRMEFIPWSRESEIADLHLIDIGLMPLQTDSEFVNGKCGFKAIQFMSIGIPVVVSPIGVNAEIVTHGVEGYHCSTEDEWRNHLSRLILDKELRKEMGRKGRERVILHYSLRAQQEAFLRAILE